MKNADIGIDPNRIYFREEIAVLWGYDYDPQRFDDRPAAERRRLLEQEEDKLRKWFKRGFTAKGLRTFPTAGRVAVHGRELSEFVLHNSLREPE